MCQALLEEERNLNASFSRKPFKTSAYMRLAPPVPHNFGIKNRSTDAVDETIDGEKENDEDKELPENERASLLRSAIKRKIMDLKLGQLVRNEYTAQEKEKILAGHFCNQSGTISVMGDRIQVKKSASSMKQYSKMIYDDLSESWPHLRFMIKLQNIEKKSSLNSPNGKNVQSTASSNTLKDKVNEKKGRLTPKRFEEGNEEMLIQFETDSQTLPAEGALHR